MPNSIKYNTSSESNALTSGNFHLGVGDVAKGPTSTTGYYNGINPPSGGYTIYLNKASQGPSIYVASNDSELISLTNSIGGQSFITAAQCKEWFLEQNDKMLVNREYETIVTDGLVFMVDAGFTPSYPGSGTAWNDLVGDDNGTLENGPTFDSGDGGSIDFDGTDDKATSTLTANTIFNSTFTVSMWFKQTDTDNTDFPRLFDKSDNASTDNGFSVFLYDLDGNDTDVALYHKITNNVPRAGTLLFNVNTWYNVTIVFTNSQFKVYVNGGSATITSHTKSLSDITTSDGFVIGNISDSNRPFAGNIAMTCIYNREITQAENTQNYNALKGRFGID